jgi:hypothetical protein
MTTLAPRPSAELSTDRHDPRDDWPDEARALADHLAGIYGDRDPLPTLAGGWVARQKSRHTRRAYVRTFKAWEEYTRSTGIHPLQAKLPLADAYAKHLAKTPTRNGKPPPRPPRRKPSPPPEASTPTPPASKPSTPTRSPPCSGPTSTPTTRRPKA